MFMLHKTFGAPKGGGGPAVGAYGCSEELAPFLPRPARAQDGERYRLERDAPQRRSAGCASTGATSRRSSRPTPGRARWAPTASPRPPTSRVLANNYMETRLLQIRGVTRSHPRRDDAAPGDDALSASSTVTRDTGISVVDVQNRMVDFGVDAFWISHEPWIVPEPFTPEAGEMWSKEDIDYWIAVLEQSSTRPTPTRSSSRPRRTTRRSTRSTARASDEPERWATTWRAHQRKAAAPSVRGRGRRGRVDRRRLGGGLRARGIRGGGARAGRAAAGKRCRARSRQRGWTGRRPSTPTSRARWPAPSTSRSARPRTWSSSASCSQRSTRSTDGVPLASSSSAITASQFAPGNPARAGRAPGNPPYLLPVVELVPAPFTDPAIVDRVEATMRAAGMSPVRVHKEIEGFIFNRLQGAVLREAYCLVRDGVASSTTSTASCARGSAGAGR